MIISAILFKFATAQFCTGLKTFIDQSSGVISSQDRSRPTYSNNQQCQFLIADSSPDSRIKLTLTEFNTECGWDFLNVYEGSNRDGVSIAKLCGNRNLPGFQNVIVSNTSSIFLDFSSDTFGEASGFQINFQVINSEFPCSTDTDCARGTCMQNTCTCPAGFSGLLCESRLVWNNTIFTPRERHSIAYNQLNDTAYISFGFSWTADNSALSDLVSYNFQTNQFQRLAPTSRTSLPVARFDHKSWFHDGKLYIYGGRSVNTQFFDIWIYDVQRNEWNAIEPDSRPPSQLRDTFEPVAIFVPKATGFDIFVYGGVNYRTNSAMRILYRFDSVINNWIIESTLGPVAYQGGSGVYHSETNSLRFITGYTLPRNYFTYEYSINSGTWNVLARRASNTLLYQTPVIYTNPEIALVHGGYSPDSVTSCFQSVVEVLDVACNNWTNLVTFPVLPRKGHGLIYRGESLWIFGGSDGILHNDVVEIPISLPITSNSTRNQCRAQSYCSMELDCRGCSMKQNCNWCNDACGITPDLANTLALPSNSSFRPILKGDLINGQCPNPPTITPISSCPDVDGDLVTRLLYYGSYVDVNFSWLNTNSNLLTLTLVDIQPNTLLRIAVIDNVPVTSTSSSGTLQYLNPRTKNSTRIRVSWANDNGIFGLNDNSKSRFNLALLRTSTTFSLRIAASTSTTSTDRGFDIMDAIIIFLIFSSVVLLTSSASYFINRAQMRRRRMLMRGYELENLPSYPDPEMYQYAFDLTQKSNEKTVPISVERFEGHGPYQLQATSFAILLPGTNAYLSQGDLPKFGIGTRIIQTNLKTEPKAKK